MERKFNNISDSFPNQNLIKSLIMSQKRKLSYKHMKNKEFTKKNLKKNTIQC